MYLAVRALALIFGQLATCIIDRDRTGRVAVLPRTGLQRGFTLLELLVVMVIIGLLAGYVAPRYFAQVGKSKVSVAKAQIDSFGKALDEFRLDTGHYPTTEEGLAALDRRPATLCIGLVHNRLFNSSSFFGS